MKTYLSNNNYKDVSSLDFQNELSAASGIDMTDFFNGWVNNPGWPHFSIDSSIVIPSGSNYSVTVFVKQKLTDAPNYFNNVPSTGSYNEHFAAASSGLFLYVIDYENISTIWYWRFYQYDLTLNSWTTMKSPINSNSCKLVSANNAFHFLE